MSQTFKQLPSPYSNYEASETGTIVRNIKTKSILKTDSLGIYKMTSSTEPKKELFINKKRVMEFILEPEEDDVVTQQEAKPKKEKVIKQEKEENQQEISEITSRQESNYIKCYKLHLLGYSNKQIAGFVGVSAGNVSRDIWMVKSGKREIPA